MEPLKIAIITVGIGLLTLIYPLTYIYLINLLRDLHLVWQEIIKKCKSNECGKPRQAIFDYQDSVTYILNIFFLSGLLFIVIFAILLFQSEEKCYNIWLIRIPILLVTFFSIWISFRKKELTRGIKPLRLNYMLFVLKCMVFVITTLCYILIFLLTCIRCANQLYLLLLCLGLLMAFQVFLWFWGGIHFRPTQHLREIQEKIYE